MRPRAPKQKIDWRRARIARSLAGLTRSELGKSSGVDARRLLRIENGSTLPTRVEVMQLSTRLGVTPQFFQLPSPHELDEETTHFRSKQSARQVARRRALAQTTLLGELLEFVDERVTLPPFRLPSEDFDSPEDAANFCRQTWGLDLHCALADIQREAELSGVLVVDGPTTMMKDVDAFSARVRTGHGVIVLNPNDAPSRNAFNVAHELGHLVLHEGQDTGDPESEREADRFASALLMPAPGFRRSWIRGPGYPEFGWLLQMKKWWRVSMQAMVVRAKTLRLIDHNTYQAFFIAISQRRWRLSEPGEFGRPAPQLLEKALRVVTETTGWTATDIAEELGLRLPTLEQVTGLRFNREEGAPSDLVPFDDRSRSSAS